jgi:hypothetical protein
LTSPGCCVGCCIPGLCTPWPTGSTRQSVLKAWCRSRDLNPDDLRSRVFEFSGWASAEVRPSPIRACGDGPAVPSGQPRTAWTSANGYRLATEDAGVTAGIGSRGCLPPTGPRPRSSSRRSVARSITRSRQRTPRIRRPRRFSPERPPWPFRRPTGQSVRRSPDRGVRRLARALSGGHGVPPAVCQASYWRLLERSQSGPVERNVTRPLGTDDVPLFRRLLRRSRDRSPIGALRRRR